MNAHVRVARRDYTFGICPDNAGALIDKLTARVDDMSQGYWADELREAAGRLCRARHEIRIAGADRIRLQRAKRNLEHMVALIDGALEAEDVA